MFQSRSSPFDNDIERATDENNLSEDWSLILQICDNATNYQDGAKFCLKAIMKRLHHNVPRVVIQALTLLDACVKNCDKRFLLQVASSEFTTEVRKLLGKMHPSVAIKLKELLQKWSLEEFKDDPELCIIPALYYKLKSEGVEFPPKTEEKKTTVPVCTDPNAVTSQEEENDIIKAIEISLKDTGRYSVPADYGSSDILSGQTSKSLPEPFKVRAIYDFDAAEDNELTIKVGEIVLVLDNSNSSWWKGSNHRGEGLFPANFVTEDLDFVPEESKIETSLVTEESTDVPDDDIKIDEKKIDAVLNWLNDVDPTEETSDPEDMVKLEKECYKMGPLIEENLQSIDKRLAMLNLVNEKIMSAFDLFHDLSDQYSTLPSNMKLYATPNILPSPFPQYYVPPVLPNVQASVSNPSNQSAIPVSLSNTSHLSNESNTNNPIENNKPTTNSTENLTVIPGTSSAASSNLPTTVTYPLPIQMAHPSTVMSSPYATNMTDVFYSPAMNLPFQPLPHQTNYIPRPITILGDKQIYMAPPATPPFLVYQYVNNLQPTTHLNNTVSSVLSENKTSSATLNTSTSVSDVLSSTSLPSSSVSSYYNDLQQITTSDFKVESTDQNLNQDAVLNPAVQTSGDVQASSTSSS